MGMDILNSLADFESSRNRPLFLFKNGTDDINLHTRHDVSFSNMIFFLHQHLDALITVSYINKS